MKDLLTGSFSPRGALWILSDRDDQMGATIKPPKKSLTKGFKQPPPPQKKKNKSLDQNLAPQKSHAKLPSHENVQKVLSDITQNIKTLVVECSCLFIHHTLW